MRCFAVGWVVGLAGASVAVADPALSGSAPAAVAAASPVRVSDERTAAEPGPLGGDAWFPTGNLFSPLVADRRWPRFEAGVEHSIGDANITNAYAVALGGTIPFQRSASDDLEWGIQTGLFATFDRDTPSLDLFNTDYVAAAYVAGRRGATSYLLRAHHTSTHLGDEFLLNNPEVERENFSMERLEAFLSREFHPDGAGLRLRGYAGVGVVIGEPDPADWGHLRGQWGLELRHSLPGLRPAGLLLAADVQHEEARGFQPDLSVVAGIEVPTDRLHSAFNLLATYYTGRSPNGQFWRDSVQIVGLRLGYTF